ncbi:hypothetical protein RSA36_19420 [Pantoea stewartii]|uniref:Transposase n=1 Tax=Pantoea stewartii TaxID=66269 RepID=A0AB34VH65_9GAMM|nr:hypothetical protein RSA30_15555 [Pantoea stewartii]KTS97663.1 hypothetical protein RSA13_11255 [Pantoea stewartii]KTT05812.1 hypothetical protein RSA36_19420 [Pantoea stewartii]
MIKILQELILSTIEQFLYSFHQDAWYGCQTMVRGTGQIKREDSQRYWRWKLPTRVRPPERSGIAESLIDLPPGLDTTFS